MSVQDSPVHGAVDARRRRRRARIALAQPGGRLHDLPAALPVPHHRPAPRDRLSPDAVRGTLVHKVLEDLFDLPAGDRTPGAGARPAGARRWEQLLEAEPELAEMFTGEGPRARGVARRRCRDRPRPLLPARGPAPARAGRARALRRGAARLQAAAPRLRRPARRRPRRRDQSGRLQDRPGSERGLGGQGAVPDEVLRAGPLANPRRGAGDAPAGLPRQRRAAPLRPRRGRPARHRAQGRGDLAGDRPRDRGPRLATPPVPAVRLVLLQGDLPRVGRHSPTAARGRARSTPAS